MQPGMAQIFAGQEHLPFFHRGTTGRAVLLIHGFPGSPAEFRPLGEWFHKQGWTAHGPLLPGFGADIETLPDRTADEWMTAIRIAYHQLRNEHDEIIVGGISMGAALAMWLAREVQPDYLLLFAPFARVEHFLWSTLPVLKVLVPRVRIFRLVGIDFEDPETRAGIRQFMPDADLDDPQTREQIRDFPLPVAMFNQVRITGNRARAAAPYLKSPALVFQGLQDEIVKPATTQYLLSNYAGPVQYHEVPGSHDLLDTSSPAWSTIRSRITSFINAQERS